MNEPWAKKIAGVGPGHFVKPLFSPPHPRPRDPGLAWNGGLIRASENVFGPLLFNTRLNLRKLQESDFL